MFNFSGSADTENVWTLLGTFYNSLPSSQKAQLQDYWQSLADVNQAAYYTLIQSDNLQYVDEDKGWFDFIYTSFRVSINELNGDGRENTIKEYLSIPKNLEITADEVSESSETLAYSYKVSATNTIGEGLPTTQKTVILAEEVSALNTVILEWDSVIGATNYNIYKLIDDEYVLLGTTDELTFTDTGQSAEDAEKVPVQTATGLVAYLFKLREPFLTLHINKLIQKSTGEELVLNEDYTIRGMEYLRFLADKVTFPLLKEDNIESDVFLAHNIITISPIISNFYFTIFSSTPKEDLIKKRLTSKLPTFDSLSLGEQAEEYGNHLKYFTWAYSYYLRKAPTLGVLRVLYALANNYPFAYKAGTVSDITGSVVTITTGEEEIKYDILDETKHSYSVTDTVKQFAILRNDIIVEDYYSDEALITSKSEELVDDIDNYQEQFFIYLKASSAFTPPSNIISKFKSIALPAGLNILEE